MKRSRCHFNIIPAMVLAAFIWLTACSKNTDAGAGADIPANTPETAELTKQVRRYSLEKRKLPQSLADLVTAGYIQSVPPAPTGKKYAIDADRAQVILVDQ